jgi:hypothetical protein
VDVEKAAVEVRDAPAEPFELRRPLLPAEPFVKETQKEVSVERVEPVLAMFGTHPIQPVAEVVSVAVEETLPLDEVDEHQAVEHDGGVPLAVGTLGDAGGELEKGRVFLLKSVVEALGDAFYVEAGAGAAGDIRQGNPVLFFQSERDGLQLLEQRVPGLGVMTRVLSAGIGLSGLALHPLPDLGRVRRIGEDDQVLVR